MLTMPGLHVGLTKASLLMLMAPPAPLPCQKLVMLTLLAELLVKVVEVRLSRLKLAA